MTTRTLRLWPCLATLLTLGLPVLSHAEFRAVPIVLSVPSAAYPTIQSGVDASHDGDTVLVADGTYTGPGNRDIDLLGKSLTVTSLNGPAKTIIDCGGYASTDGSGNHRGFYIHSGEKKATISGFTVKNGYETDISSIPDSSYGGGIFNSNSDGGTITLTNCTITANTASSGGGIFNENDGSGTITLTNCTITGNTAASSGGWGGVFNLNGTTGSGTITLTNCTITGNTAAYVGGGIFNSNGNASTTDSATITLTNCTILGNTAAYGGGVENESVSGTITLTSCTITGNAATSSGGGVDNFNGNTSSATITLTNNVIYGDIGGEVFNFANTPAIVSYCDVQGGYSGTGNIDADPLFVNAATGDLHLKPGSPCLGAGTSNGAPATDKEGNMRPNPPSMGAYDLGTLATITGFTITPNQIAAPGPVVTANVSVTGNFAKVTVSPAPGSLSTASPTFNLLTNSGGGWGGTLPTNFLKLAKTNPITFVATGTRPDGTTTSLMATLRVGPLPALTFSLVLDKTAVHRNETFTLSGYASNLSTVLAATTTIQITLPHGVNYVSSNGFAYDTFTRTLTSAISPLLPGGGTYPLSIMLQADSNAPKQTPLVITASASCANFQTATQNPTVSVEPGLIPLGVEVNATGGFGILDGSASVDFSKGNSPLHSTLTPKTSLINLFHIFGDTHRASIWLEIFVSTRGSATYAPGGDGAAQFLAEKGLMSPSVSPSYDAAFQNVGDSVSVTASFTPRAAGLTLIDTMLIAAAANSGKPIPNADLVLSVWDDLSQLSSFATAINAFTRNPPKNQFQFFQDVALASKALLTMGGPEKQLIINSLKKHNLIGDGDVSTIKGFQKLLGVAFGVNTLAHIAADAVTIDGATLGQPMTVSFEALPFPN